MVVCIRAFDRTLVGNHVYSREEVLGSIPSTPKFLPKIFASRRRLLRNAPSKRVPGFFGGCGSGNGIQMEGQIEDTSPHLVASQDTRC